MPRFVASALLLLGLAAFPAVAQHKAEPGVFDYYLLTLSWSPSFCAGRHDDPAAREECGRHRGFVVHGLWPQDEDGSWPEFCRTVARVPEALVARERGAMPNARLIEHEWERHGSCTGGDAPAYFGQLDRAAARFVVPAPLRAPHERVLAAVNRLEAMLAESNPGLAPDMMALECRPHSALLEEIRLCMDKALAWRRCGAKVVNTCPARVELPPAGR